MRMFYSLGTASFCKLKPKPLAWKFKFKFKKMLSLERLMYFTWQGVFLCPRRG